MTTFSDYQSATDETAIYPDAGEGTMEAIQYCVFGAIGEAGELANKLKKVLRDHDGEMTDDDISGILHETGDVLWYLARLCVELDENLETVAEDNIEKLLARQKRNTLHGVGDDR